MTDYCDRFFLFIEAADKLLCPRVDPDRVGIQRSTGEKHGIEVSRIGLIECHVNIELIGFVVVLHRIYFACLGCDQCAMSSGLFERVAWFSQFRILNSICGENGDAQSLHVPVGSHPFPPVWIWLVCRKFSFGWIGAKL